MKQFGKILLLTLGFGMLLAVLSFLPSGQVGADATKDVLVVNSSSQAVPLRDVDRPTAQPFNHKAPLKWHPGFAFANADSSGILETFTVPDGKRLVIEFVSLQIVMPPGDNVLFARLGTRSTVPTVTLTVTHAGTDFQNNEAFTATHRVFTILEPGTVVEPTAFCKGTCTTSTASQGGFIFISGYLVDVI